MATNTLQTKTIHKQNLINLVNLLDFSNQQITFRLHTQPLVPSRVSLSTNVQTVVCSKLIWLFTSTCWTRYSLCSEFSLRLSNDYWLVWNLWCCSSWLGKCWASINHVSPQAGWIFMCSWGQSENVLLIIFKDIWTHFHLIFFFKIIIMCFSQSYFFAVIQKPNTADLK